MQCLRYVGVAVIDTEMQAETRNSAWVNFDRVMRGGNAYLVSSSRQGLDPKTRPSRRLPLVVLEKSLRCVALMKRHAPRLQ